MGDVTESSTVVDEVAEPLEPAAPVADPAPVVDEVVEPEVPAAPAEGDKPVLLDQAAVDKILGAERRKTREKLEKLEALEAQVEALLKKDHENLLDKLAVGGVKRERLERTGLTGEALETFANELAADIAEVSSAAPKTLKLNDVLLGATGVKVAGNLAPGSQEEALAAIKVRFSGGE